MSFISSQALCEVLPKDTHGTAGGRGFSAAPRCDPGGGGFPAPSPSPEGPSSFIPHMPNLEMGRGRGGRNGGEQLGFQRENGKDMGERGVQNGRKCHPVQRWKDLTLGGPEKDPM